MTLWGWVLIGVAAWLAPAVVAALMFVWGILRPPRARPVPGALQPAEKPVATGQPHQEAQLSPAGEPPREGKPPSAI